LRINQKKRKLEKSLNLTNDIKIQDMEKLIALFQFLKTISIYRESFKLDTSLEIDECIIKFILEQSQKSNDRTEIFNILLLESYNCLINSVVYSSDSTSPCLSYAIKIFSLGLNDYSVKIREICKDALIKCNSLIHPYLPSIYKSSSIQKNIKKTIESKEKEQMNYSFENSINEPINNPIESSIKMDMDEDENYSGEINDDNIEDVQEVSSEKQEEENIQPKIIKTAKKVEEEHFIINNPEKEILSNEKEVSIIPENHEKENEEDQEKANSSSSSLKEETVNVPTEDENDDENSDSDIELPDIIVDSDDE